MDNLVQLTLVVAGVAPAINLLEVQVDQMGDLEK
jgi:hypothetical protein